MRRIKWRILFFIFMMLSTVTAWAQSNLIHGKKLYELKCGRCHLAYAPQKYSGDEWKTILKEMGILAGLTAEDEKSILTYLEQNAGAKKTGELPTSPVLAGYLYTDFFASPSSIDTFDIHYLNINLTGRIHERVSYRAEFEFEHGGGKNEPPFVEQAYLDIWFKRNMSLRIGAFLTPFNRFDDFHAPLENLMVTRPQMSREIGVSAWKEVGINFRGNVFLRPDLYLNYDAYIINGLGSGSRLRASRQYRDNNDAKSVGYRISSVFRDAWELGTSLYYGAWDDEGDFGVALFGFHFLGKIADFTMFAEYAKGVSENPDMIEKGRMDGYFLQGSYLFLDKFRVSLRLESLDYYDPGYLLGRSPTNFDRKILGVGFNYYLTPAVVFKAEYDFYFPGDREDNKNGDLLSLQAAVRF